jgi:hypothetical protein
MIARRSALMKSGRKTGGGRLVTGTVLVRHCLVLLVFVVGAASCAWTGDGGDEAGAASSQRGIPAASEDADVAGVPNGDGDVDPQIFEDVVAFGFTTPSRQRRAIRVSNMIGNLRIERCGRRGPILPLSDTFIRFDQAYYADISLVHEKGLAEPPPAGGGPLYVESDGSAVPIQRDGSDVVADCNDSLLPSFPLVFSVLDPIWREATLAVAGQQPVQAEASLAAACLEDLSGFDLGDSDQIASYLAQVDMATVSAATTDESNDPQRRFSDYFVECTDGYFSAIEEGLEQVLPELIERNRELLDALAFELAAMGYVP